MTRESLQNPRLPAPIGYSRAVRATGTTTIWTSMTAPVASDGSVIGPGDARRQAAAALDNIRDILEDHGSGLEDVVQLSAFVVAPDDLAAVAEVLAQTFAPTPPALSLLGGVHLPSPTFAVEIAVVAVLAT